MKTRLQRSREIIEKVSPRSMKRKKFQKMKEETNKKKIPKDTLANKIRKDATIQTDSNGIKEHFKDGKDDLNLIYQNLRSVPNYSAKINDFLRENGVHSKFRRIVKHKFPRRRIIVSYPYQIFMSDLIEYSQPGMKFANRGFVYILVVIDCFTKKVFARGIKKKNGVEMANALNSILQELDHFPNSLITDEGLEYYNTKVKNLLNSYAIHHYSIKTKMKACMVERFNRTLKNRIEKYFYANNTKNWIDVLDQFISNYNQTYHRSIGMSPDRVTDKNANEVFKRLYPNLNLKVAPRLSVGDKVRILKEKTIFEKGYSRSWSNEIYKISAVKQTAGRVWYKLKTAENISVPGIKYYWELNLVSKNNDH